MEACDLVFDRIRLSILECLRPFASKLACIFGEWLFRPIHWSTPQLIVTVSSNICTLRKTGFPSQSMLLNSREKHQNSVCHLTDALGRDDHINIACVAFFNSLVAASAAARLEVLSSRLISSLFASALSYKYVLKKLVSTSYHQPHNASYPCSNLLVRRVLLCICVDGTQAGSSKFVL